MLFGIAIPTVFAQQQASVGTYGVATDSFSSVVTQEFFHNSFYPGPTAAAIGTASLGFGFNRLRDAQSESLGAVLERRMASRLIFNSVWYGAALALHEDDTWRTPRDGKIKFQRAILNIASVQRPNGKWQVAWPRLLALAGTVAIESQWHPWVMHEPNPARKLGAGVSFFAIKSFYYEYASRRVERLKKNLMAKYFHR